jgi:hypothetical protein
MSIRALAILGYVNEWGTSSYQAKQEPALVV